MGEVFVLLDRRFPSARLLFSCRIRHRPQDFANGSDDATPSSSGTIQADNARSTKACRMDDFRYPITDVILLAAIDSKAAISGRHAPQFVPAPVIVPIAATLQAPAPIAE